MKMIEHGHCLFASEVCAAEEVGDDKWVLRDVDEDEPGVPPPSGACCRDLTVACHGSLRFEGVLLVPLFLFWVFQYAASQYGDASLLSAVFLHHMVSLPHVCTLYAGRKRRKNRRS